MPIIIPTSARACAGFAPCRTESATARHGIKKKTSRQFVRNALADYDINKSSIPTRRAAPLRPKMVPDVVEFPESNETAQLTCYCPAGRFQFCAKQ